MRIIAGKWRSRRIVRPRTKCTRPWPDRVKETVFNILGEHFGCPGTLPQSRVADVFAGSGSMGLEALSRGAAHCWFYERNSEVLDVLRGNIQTLGAEDMSTIVRRDAWNAAVADAGMNRVDLMFLDPPYRDSDDSTAGGAVTRFFDQLGLQTGVRPLVVLHHRAGVCHAGAGGACWSVLDSRKIGSNAVTIFAA